MHKTQQLIILTGVILVVLMAIFPPWAYVDGHQVSHPMGYAPIWKPPIERHQNSAEILGFKLQLDVQTQTANTIDLFRLLLQVVILSAVTGGAVVLLRRVAV